MRLLFSKAILVHSFIKLSKILFSSRKIYTTCIGIQIVDDNCYTPRLGRVCSANIDSRISAESAAPWNTKLNFRCWWKVSKLTTPRVAAAAATNRITWTRADQRCTTTLLYYRSEVQKCSSALKDNLLIKQQAYDNLYVNLLWILIDLQLPDLNVGWTSRLSPGDRTAHLYTIL